jgi:hypothetical protein
MKNYYVSGKNLTKKSQLTQFFYRACHSKKLVNVFFKYRFKLSLYNFSSIYAYFCKKVAMDEIIFTHFHILKNHTTKHTQSKINTTKFY